MLDDILYGKSILKMIMALYGALLMLLGSLNLAPGGVQDISPVPDDFTPIARLAVASDVHIADEGSEAEKARLAQMFETAYRIASEDAAYGNLDAFCFCGDVTNAGTESSMQTFKSICDEHIRPGSQLITVLGNHDFKTLHEDTRAMFERVFGYSADKNFTVNGIHVVTIARNGDDSARSLAQKQWLTEQLNAAKAESAVLPIIVLQHEHVFNTVYGSVNWGDPDLKSILVKYPQVIDFSGHSHYPMNDPRSIWQGNFTALGTGTLSYFELENEGEAGLFPDGNENAAQFYIVEIAADGATRIRMYDLISDGFFGETYYIATPSDSSTFPYTTENRMAKSNAPVFASDAQITAEATASGATALTFPAATDELIVHNYKVTVQEESGKYVYEQTKLSDYYYIPSPDSYTLDVGVLKKGCTYRATVIAVDAYSRDSLPLTLDFVA